jgi:hypothetical protein
MHRAIFVATLGGDGRQRPYGAVTQRPYGLRAERQTSPAWRRKTATTSCCAAPHGPHTGTAKAKPFARVASLLQINGKRAEN